MAAVFNVLPASAAIDFLARDFGCTDWLYLPAGKATAVIGQPAIDFLFGFPEDFKASDCLPG